MGFGIYFVLFETFQLVLRPYDYFTDFWNVFDLFRSVLLLAYVFLEMSYSITEGATSPDFLNLVLSALNLLSWFRALSYLRLFQGTRVFISLLVQTIVDMKAFTIVLAAALLGFTTTYGALNPSEQFSMSLKSQYRVMFGDFDTDDYDTVNWILFFIASVLMCLVMLNMLIAIMGDTYGKVMGEIVPSDYQELNNMILE